MAKKNKYRARVESVQEENHDGGWDSTWDQGGWDQSGHDQNGWQNTLALNSDVLEPGDSVSNASYANTNTDWEVPPPPPSKDVPMHAAANGWGWAGAAAEPPARSPMKERNQYDVATARGMQSMLGAIAEQRQMQEEELIQQIQQQHQRAQDLAYVHGNQGQTAGRGKHGKHRREESTSWGGGWGQASDAGTSQSRRAAGVSWGDAWGSALATEGPRQDGNGNNWAGADEGSGTNTKSKKKRARGEDQRSNAQTNANNNKNGWGAAGGESSLGAVGAWDSALPGMASTSAAAGGFGSTTGGWGDWGVNNEATQAPDLIQSQSWGGWSEAQQDVQKGKTPKSGVSRFFARLFKGRGKGKDKGKEQEREPQNDIWADEMKGRGKKGKMKHVQVQEQNAKGKVLKKQKFAEPEATAWPDSEKEGEEEEDYNDGNDNVWGTASGTGGWVSETNNGWGESAPVVPSKAPDGWGASPPVKSSNPQANVAEGRISEAGRSRSETHSIEHHFIESRGEALVPARRALFSAERLARDRMLWFFDPRKDMRVSSLLDWIEHMRYPLATFGFSKFLESRERGALFANADYRSPSAPLEPVFDWLTFDKIQRTMDRTLQESLAFYNPSSQIIVFVFLLSKSKSSMAIWRRKLPLPDNIRHTYGTQITKVVASLNKQYPIHVDEMPNTAPTNLNRTTSNKRRWLNWG